MKEMKRILALVLCFVMLVGMMPMAALRAEAADTTQYLMFATDRHENKSIIDTLLDAMGTQVEYVCLGGDMMDSQNTYNSSTVLSEVQGTERTHLTAENVDIVAGNHDEGANDDAGIFNSSSGYLYSGEDYHVYGVAWADVEEESTTAQAFAEWGSALNDGKVIIVMSHMPLHSKRGDNSYAYLWHNALNAVAADENGNIVRDVIFLHGHNHTDERTNYAYSVGQGYNVEGAGTVTNYYTYGTAGYLNANNEATLIAVNDSTVTLTRYNSSGATETYATVTRVADSGSGDSGSTDESTPTNPTDPTDSGNTGDSTETVVGEATVNTATDSSWQTVTVGKEITTTKTVYVLTEQPVAGKSYLIVNGNEAGDGYHALANNNGSVAATGVTIKTDSEIGTYIELTDAADELWTVASGLTFKNGSQYLGYTTSGSWGNNYTFGLSTTERSWSYSNNRLSTSVGSWSPTTYYLRYNDGWTWTSSTSASGRSVYFYVPTDVTITTGSSTTYSVTASDVAYFLDESLTASIEASTNKAENATFTYEVEGGDEIITSMDADGTIHFNGNVGTAQVKVSYTWTEGENEYTIWKVINVTATEPTYTLDIISDGAVVTGTTIAKKGVTASTTLQLGTKVYADGTEVTIPAGATVEWHIPEEYHSIATVNHDTGLVSFKGVDGAFYVTATMTLANGKDITVGVNISATTSSYSVPSDGVSDFPEYPNEGAIRFDKTATAVGNFSETGIAQLELSMTGVPYTTGSEIDVVMMLDITGSMDDNSNRIPGTKAAAIAFLESIVINEDGSYNKNRIGVYWFNKNGSGTVYDFGTIDDDDELAAAKAAINSFDDNQASGGTPYDDGLSKCQEVLTAAKKDGVGNNRQQFCVFMSDGVPTSYAYVNGTTYGTLSSASSIAGMMTSASNYATRDTDYKYEYYSTEMKKAGVTVYTVGLGLENKNSAWNGGSATQCLNLASALLNDISGPANETAQPDAVGTSTLSKKDKYFFSVEDATAATEMKKVFTNIAQKILQAATDVTVEDKITDEYTMIFDIPEGTKDITGVTNDFYIEFGKYALDEDHERTEGGFTSVTKLYLTNNNGTLSAKDSTAPVFAQKTIGEKGTLYYWSTNAADGDAGISVTVSGTTYYFVSYGMKEAGYNMTSGAYANGTVDADTNMSQNLVIATPYFVYNANTRMIYWTVDKLDTEECVLRYFLYLDDSATEVGTNKEADPGSYPTNDHAYISYTNFKGHDCRQEFPKPQLTWSGAQVSYVFYLVNTQGQPINKSGQVVDFANATFVTDIYTENTVWNKGADGHITADSQLSIDWLASELLPADYKVYDEDASYQLHVYGDHTGASIFDYFTIDGSTAAEISASLNDRLTNADTTATTVSLTTTKVYNTKAGQKITGYGTYTSEEASNITGETVLTNFDFYNTTVAFAVVWQPALVPDTVVVDYGLDVLINVVQNDLMQNHVSGIGAGKDAYGNTAMNTGVSGEAKLGTNDLIIDGNTISIENENQIRFHQGDMQFNAPVVFYYESPVEYYEGSQKMDGFMYSSVTVIPATTIYYEDSFVTLETYTNGVMDETSGWTTEGTVINGVQQQDRPGESQISAALDADNNYGYDAAYETMSKYSMGSSAMVHVAAGKYATAQFTFYGTGFDIISLTDATTGIITINVYQGTDTTAKPVLSESVDTYYGYVVEYWNVTYTYTDGAWVKTGETKLDARGEKNEAPAEPAEGDNYTTCETRWVTTGTDNTNALYQVPVMKIGDGNTTEVLPYGQYTAVITATYIPFLDHNKTDTGYNFYLDAIRVYNPTGNQNDDANDAYVQDGEGWPEYFEVRDKIISANTFETVATDAVEGIVFIDGYGNTSVVSDYASYGPNNELYLAPGQAVTFTLTPGTNVAKVQMALKTVANSANVEVYTIENGAKGQVLLSQTISTASDMYYTIWETEAEKDAQGNMVNTQASEMTLVIRNSGEEGVLSITNVKITHTQAPATGRMMVFSVRRTAVEDALATLNTVEEPETEPTEPETEPTEPETEPTEPETEPTEPETEPTEPETEPTEPETEPTEPTHEEKVEQVVREVVKIIKGFFGWLFG